MKFRGTFILLILAIALGSFTYFYEIRGGKSREEAEEKAKKVFDLKENGIDSIEIHRPGVEALKLEKSDSGDWSIASPIKARADSGAVETLTWQLAEFQFLQVAAEETTDLAPFGLTTPEMRVNFAAAGKNYNIIFGADTRIGFDAYFMVEGDAKVYVAGRSTKQALDKHAADLRDKRVVAFDRADLVGMTIVTGESTIAFERDETDWRITKPREMDADDNMLQGLVDQLSTLEAEEFIPDVVAKTQYPGAPDMEITLIIGEKERASKKISFKLIENGEKVLAQPDGEAWAYKISTTVLLSDAGQPAESFRERRVLKFDRFDLREIVVARDGDDNRIGLAKDDKGDWNIKEPESAKGKASAGKVFDFIDKLEELEADGFVDDQSVETGIGDSPAVVLYEKGDDESAEKKEIKLFLGNKRDDGKIYARGNGEQIFLIHGDLGIPKNATELTESEPGAVPEPMTRSLSVE